MQPETGHQTENGTEKLMIGKLKTDLKTETRLKFTCIIDPRNLLHFEDKDTR